LKAILLNFTTVAKKAIPATKSTTKKVVSIKKAPAKKVASKKPETKKAAKKNNFCNRSSYTTKF
jgi:hypothetical protein